MWWAGAKSQLLMAGHCCFLSLFAKPPAKTKTTADISTTLQRHWEQLNWNRIKSNKINQIHDHFGVVRMKWWRGWWQCRLVDYAGQLSSDANNVFNIHQIIFSISLIFIICNAAARQAAAPKLQTTLYWQSITTYVARGKFPKMTSFLFKVHEFKTSLFLPNWQLIINGVLKYNQNEGFNSKEDLSS